MLAPGYLEAAAALLDDPHVDAVYTSTQACGISQEVWSSVLALPRALVYGAPSTFLHKRELFDGLGGYTARLRVGADKDFWLRALSAGYTFKFLAKPLYLKRIRLQSMTSAYGSGVIGTMLDEHRDLYLAHLEDALALAATRYRQKLHQRRRIDKDRHELKSYRQMLLGQQ